MGVRERILEELQDDVELVFLEPDVYDRAIVGVVARFGGLLAVCYDTEIVLDVLMQDGMTGEEAMEWFEVNIIGGWVGDATPVFLTRPPAETL